MIKLIRVDHRLIHGQVAVAWFGNLKANSLLIANDDVVMNPIRKASLKMATPSGSKLVMQNIDTAIESINSGVTDKYHLMVIVETIHDAYRLIQGMKQKPNRLNIGGTKSLTDTLNIAKAVDVSLQDIDELETLTNEGVNVEIQLVPSSNKQTLSINDFSKMRGEF